MGWARDFGSNQAAEIPEYFVYFGICAVQSWGKRSGQTAKRFFWGRTNTKSPHYVIAVRALRAYFRPKRLLKRSTRPPVSTSFCLPV